MYQNGEGVEKNLEKSLKWSKNAAENGHVRSQLKLWSIYRQGEFVSKDEIEALAWLYVVKGKNPDEKEMGIKREQLNMLIDAGEDRVGKGNSLLAQQRAKEINQIIEAKRKSIGNKTKNKPSEPKKSGTGTFVSEDGLILTAAHVVEGANSINVITNQGLLPATIQQIDKANDIAILRCKGKFSPLPIINSKSVRVGQAVFTIGFPQTELQGFNPKFTKGEISSQTGMQDDPRHWQISVPVQPGNSGGPLLDESGNIVGIVVSGLNAIAVAKHTGSLPQNVNYALKSSYIRPLLEHHDINLTSTSKPGARLEDVVEQTQKSIVMILVY
jgi:S1-C subfamily serine protease